MKVFIGSSSKEEIDKKCLDIMKEVAHLLKDEELVFGLANSSMMGICYKEFKKIIGVTTNKYKKDAVLLSKSKNTVVDTSIDRLKYIDSKYDIAIIMPGGIGTLSELFALLEEKRDKGDKRQFIIYNYNGFYDKLIEFIKDLTNQKFISEKDLLNYKIVNNINELREEIYGK